MGYPDYLHLQFVSYSILTLAFTLLLFFEKRFDLPAAITTVTSLQFILEISIESAIIYATGNVHSPFSALFILTIVSAALLYRLVGTLIMASAVSLSYSFIIWYGLYDPAQPVTRPLQTIFSAEDSVFYAIFIHILIFYLVAFMSGYLADRLRREKEALANTSSQLRRARLETDDILRHVNSGLLTVDAGGHLIYFNRAAEKILGFREEEVKGMPCDEVFAERMPDLANSLRQALSTGKDQPRCEIQAVNGEGRAIPLGLSTSVLIEETGARRGVIAIFSDLTDAKAMEAKVRAADRLAAVGELSASIAHEIRNPLAAISGSVEVLNKELELTGQDDQLMQLIVKESHRLSKILSDFLSYARIGRPAYNKVDLGHIINDVIKVTRHHHSYSDAIGITLSDEADMSYVVGDADLFKQLLLNLSLNACDAFAGRSGQIAFVVKSNVAAGQIHLFISDNGPGYVSRRAGANFRAFLFNQEARHRTGPGYCPPHLCPYASGYQCHFRDRPRDHL